MIKSLLHSLRRLPHNLRSIRPYWLGWCDLYHWSLSLGLTLDLAKRHEVDPYLIHFDALFARLVLGPVLFEVGLQDTN